MPEMESWCRGALEKKTAADLTDMLTRSPEYPPETVSAIRAVLSERGAKAPQESTIDPEAAAIESLKKARDWFLATRTAGGEQHLFDKAQFIASLRKGALEGSITAAGVVDVYTKKQDGTWSKTTTPLAQFAKSEFKLGVLFEPVWSHARAGLKWGTLIGIGLKLLDTLILLANSDPRLAFMFLVAIAVCFIPLTCPRILYQSLMRVPGWFLAFVLPSGAARREP